MPNTHNVDAGQTISSGSATKAGGGQSQAQPADSGHSKDIALRQESDVTLAAILLEEEIVSEQRLGQVLSDWTIHGTESLGEHLVRAGVISVEECERLRRQVEEKLDDLATDLKATVIDDATGIGSLTVDQIDTSGRVATVLGIGITDAEGCRVAFPKLHGTIHIAPQTGAGGLGTVWLARDDHLNRLVALKEINPRVAQDLATVSRFQNEAKVTGRREHPSIVPIYQFAEDLETGQTFYTMRFLGKQTMQAAITEYHERREAGDHDPMLLHHLLSAFVSVCQAIGYAHSKGVIHRDLKPENVALDGFGQVIVLDWGWPRAWAKRNGRKIRLVRCRWSLTRHIRPSPDK